MRSGPEYKSQIHPIQLFPRKTIQLRFFSFKPTQLSHDPLGFLSLMGSRRWYRIWQAFCRKEQSLSFQNESGATPRTEAPASGRHLDRHAVGVGTAGGGGGAGVGDRVGAGFTDVDLRGGDVQLPARHLNRKQRAAASLFC